MHKKKQITNGSSPHITDQSRLHDGRERRTKKFLEKEFTLKLNRKFLDK